MVSHGSAVQLGLGSCPEMVSFYTDPFLIKPPYHSLPRQTCYRQGLWSGSQITFPHSSTQLRTAQVSTWWMCGLHRLNQMFQSPQTNLVQVWPTVCCRLDKARERPTFNMGDQLVTKMPQAVEDGFSLEQEQDDLWAWLQATVRPPFFLSHAALLSEILLSYSNYLKLYQVERTLGWNSHMLDLSSDVQLARMVGHHWYKIHSF